MRKEPILKAVKGYEHQIKTIESDMSKMQKDLKEMDQKREEFEARILSIEEDKVELEAKMSEKVNTLNAMLNHKFEVQGKLQATQDFAKKLMD